jgi:hypothetical protein
MTQFTPILAEVADKEPTLAAIWCIAAFLCFVCLLLCRWRTIAGLIVLPLAGVWAWALLSEIHDPYAGPAILEELGRAYIAQAYIAVLLPFLVVAIGFRRKRHHVA